jgi:hypothetical protein
MQSSCGPVRFSITEQVNSERMMQIGGTAAGCRSGELLLGRPLSQISPLRGTDFEGYIVPAGTIQPQHAAANPAPVPARAQTRTFRLILRLLRRPGGRCHFCCPNAAPLATSCPLHGLCSASLVAAIACPTSLRVYQSTRPSSFQVCFLLLLLLCYSFGSGSRPKLGF